MITAKEPNNSGTQRTKGPQKVKGNLGSANLCPDGGVASPGAASCGMGLSLSVPLFQAISRQLP